ncbi:MAG: hypothetical protein IH627_03835 [Rubrivivax sp.]|nr:hypothetical protein [Rubrivivax sp.]
MDGVTGSCHQLTLPDGQSVLIDCGLFQGAETSVDGAVPRSGVTKEWGQVLSIKPLTLKT